MNRSIIRALNSINQRFYTARAEEFSATRERPWKGWDELFDRLRTAIPDEPRVLDVGCGNGRFARFLAKRLGARFTYDGVDASPLALEHARKRIGGLSRVRLFGHDFITSDDPLPHPLVEETFDLVVLFGVLHHVPGRDHRARLLQRLSENVAPGGLLVYAVWRFDRFERFRRKLVPWEEFSKKTGVQLRADELEPGDYIMTWGEGESAFRYCHALQDEEARNLSSSLDLKALDAFDGDGGLNRYFVFVRPAEDASEH